MLITTSIKGHARIPWMTLFMCMQNLQPIAYVLVYNMDEIKMM